MKKVRAAFDRANAKYDFSSFTKEDYHRICQAENVTPVEIKLSGDGYYILSRKKNLYAYINLKLTDEDFLETAAFILGCHFCGGRKRFQAIKKNPELYKSAQIEADCFAELILGRSLLDTEVLTDVLEAEIIYE